MSKFVEVDDGFINLSFVARIKQFPIGNTVESIFYGADGERLGKHMGEVTAAGLNAVIVPAPPGYVVVGVSIDEDGPYVYEDEVVAFHVGASEYDVVPYTLDGVPCVRWPSGWAIRTPEGKLVSPGDAKFDNVDAFVATIVKRYKYEEERERQQKAKALANVFGVDFGRHGPAICRADGSVLTVDQVKAILK